VVYDYDVITEALQTNS